MIMVYTQDEINEMLKEVFEITLDHLEEIQTSRKLDTSKEILDKHIYYLEKDYNTEIELLKTGDIQAKLKYLIKYYEKVIDITQSQNEKRLIRNNNIKDNIKFELEYERGVRFLDYFTTKKNRLIKTYNLYTVMQMFKGVDKHD